MRLQKQERPIKDMLPLLAYTCIHFKELRRKDCARGIFSSKFLQYNTLTTIFNIPPTEQAKILFLLKGFKQITYLYPFGFLTCQFHASLHISAKSCSARHPKILAALSTLAQTSGKSPARLGPIS